MFLSIKTDVHTPHQRAQRYFILNEVQSVDASLVSDQIAPVGLCGVLTIIMRVLH